MSLHLYRLYLVVVVVFGLCTHLAARPSLLRTSYFLSFFLFSPFVSSVNRSGMTQQFRSGGTTQYQKQYCDNLCPRQKTEDPTHCQRLYRQTMITKCSLVPPFFWNSVDGWWHHPLERILSVRRNKTRTDLSFFSSSSSSTSFQYLSLHTRERERDLVVGERKFPLLNFAASH